MRNRNDTPSKRRVIDAALDRHANLPSRQLARMLYKQHRELFPTQDAAYCSIRYRRGAKGEAFRQKRQTHHAHRRTPCPPIPPSKATAWPTVALPPGRILLLGDLHFPYHDPAAIDAALCYGEQHKANHILLNGDTIDFYSCSRFETNPKERNLRGELEAAEQFFKHLRHRFPRARIFFKKGNHDERWDSFIWAKAPELWDLPQMQLENITNMAAHRIEMLPRRARITAHKLNILHGHELDKGFIAPVNPARGAFLRSVECTVVHHFHRTSEHIERSVANKQIACFSAACLCGLWPDYAVANKWNHGFALVENTPTGFTMHNKRIMDGRVL